MCCVLIIQLRLTPLKYTHTYKVCVRAFTFCFILFSVQYQEVEKKTILMTQRRYMRWSKTYLNTNIFLTHKLHVLMRSPTHKYLGKGCTYDM